MIGALTLVGLIASGFGVFTLRALGEATPFATAHLVGGGTALAAALTVALLRIGRARQPALLGPTLRVLSAGALTIALALAHNEGGVRAALRSDSNAGDVAAAWCGPTSASTGRSRAASNWPRRHTSCSTSCRAPSP